MRKEIKRGEAEERRGNSRSRNESRFRGRHFLVPCAIGANTQDRRNILNVLSMHDKDAYIYIYIYIYRHTYAVIIEYFINKINIFRKSYRLATTKLR